MSALDRTPQICPLPTPDELRLQRLEEALRLTPAERLAVVEELCDLAEAIERMRAARGLPSSWPGAEPTSAERERRGADRREGSL